MTLKRFIPPVAILALTIGPMAIAQDNQDEAADKLRDIQQEIDTSTEKRDALSEEAARLQAEAARLREQMVAAAADIATIETQATSIETRVIALEADFKAKQTVLNARRDELVTLLAALERLSTRPAATTLLQPGEALSTARSASLMGKLIPQIQEKADALKTELAALAETQKKLSAERFDLKNTIEALRLERANMNDLRRKRLIASDRARRQAQQEQAKLNQLAREAKDLQDLINKLAERAIAEREKAEREAAANNLPLPARRPTGIPSRNFADARGTLPYPASGRIITAYGAREGAITSKGIRIQTRAGGQVIAPFDGQIVFSGNFRDYGELLIIEHTGGYHSLLAGLNERFAITGQWVLTGEPVGSMGNRNPELYLELRHRSRAINPKPWLK